MNRLDALMEHLPEILRRDAAGEPPLFPSSHPLQRPRYFLPGLRTQPWHDASEFAWTAAFGEAHAEIRDELERFLAQQQVTFRNYIGPIEHEKADAGEWHVLYLDYRSHRWSDHCAKFPRLMSLVDAVPRRSGTVFVSRLTPGAHIPPHCGATNAQLTCHFGIVVPDRVELRVGSEIRTQPEGRCILFDDSIEHEVWNRSTAVRYNLFFQIWHPDLSDGEIAAIRQIEQIPQIRTMVDRYLEGTSIMEPVPN